MSNLNSVADVLVGFPPNGKSGLVVNYPQKAAETPEIIEGDFLKIDNAAGEPVLTKLTSARIQAIDLAMNVPDQAWLALEGMDQTDSEASLTVTALKMKTGVIFKVAAGVAFTPGDLVRADAGKPAAVTAGTDSIIVGPPAVNALKAEQPVAQVVEYNATTGHIIAVGC